MPATIISDSQGLVVQTGEGCQIGSTTTFSAALNADTATGVKNNGFFAGFIPAVSNVATPVTLVASPGTAIPVTNYISYLSATSIVSGTLADGTAAGQIKKLVCTTAAATPKGAVILTSSGSDANAKIVFTVVGDTAELMWNGSFWLPVALYNQATGSPATPVLGTITAQN